MTLTELIEEVYALTNRPDLEVQTKSAVKAATLKMHSSDFYPKDIYETGIQFDEAAYIHSFDMYSFVSNMRAVKYLRVADNASDQNGAFLEIISPEEVLDSYNRNRTNIAYAAGRNLEIRAAAPFKYAYFGCYVLPTVTEANYGSWIADLQPYAIIYEAARNIFKLIGYDEEASAYNGLVAEELQLLKINHLATLGY